MWAKWLGAQAVMFIVGLLGKFLILPLPCAFKFWCKAEGFNNRIIDVWKWVWLNKLYGNPEDGVSGKQALIWTWDGVHDAVRVPYMPNSSDFVRSYLWSAWRNSCDSLKYRFANPSGTLVLFSIFGLKLKAGYQMENGFNVPVFGRA